MSNCYVFLDVNIIRRFTNYIKFTNIKFNQIKFIVNFNCSTGRIYSIPTLIEMPKRQKYVQIASGFDHTIMLAESGSVFSMGLGT